MSRIYERRGALPSDPGRSGKRPKAPHRRGERPDVPRPGARRRDPSSAGRIPAEQSVPASDGAAL